MNVVVGSAFRNSVSYVPRYMDQVFRLRQYLGSPHNVRIVAAEGDSTDGTQKALERNAFIRYLRLQIVNCDHGQPWFGSTEAPARMKALSMVGNVIFDAVLEEDDVLVYVESDLIWDASVIGGLISSALCRFKGFDVFAPMVFAGEAFYDIFAFRKNGERFIPFPPYHIGLEAGVTEIDSAGSCLVMRGEVARAARIRNDHCLVGWCEDARAFGYKIAVDPASRIYQL